MNDMFVARLPIQQSQVSFFHFLPLKICIGATNINFNKNYPCMKLLTLTIQRHQQLSRSERSWLYIYKLKHGFIQVGFVQLIVTTKIGFRLFGTVENETNKSFVQVLEKSEINQNLYMYT